MPAGVSADYYVRLEQGRDQHPSDQVIEALGRALQLDDDGVAHLRRLAAPAATGPEVDDPRLEELVGELSVRSDRFRKLWARHDVKPKRSGRSRIDHPQVGELDLGYEKLPIAAADRPTLVLYHAEPNSKSAQGLTLLASAAVGIQRRPIEPLGHACRIGDLEGPQCDTEILDRWEAGRKRDLRGIFVTNPRPRPSRPRPQPARAMAETAIVSNPGRPPDPAADRPGRLPATAPSLPSRPLPTPPAPAHHLLRDYRAPRMLM